MCFYGVLLALKNVAIYSDSEHYRKTILFVTICHVWVA